MLPRFTATLHLSYAVSSFSRLSFFATKADFLREANQGSQGLLPSARLWALRHRARSDTSDDP